MRLAPELLRAGWIIFFVLILAQVLFNAPVRSDLSAFLPEGSTETQQLLMEGLQEGPTARFWLISLGGETPEVLATVSRELARRLEDSEQFRLVRNGSQGIDEKERELLFGWRYLLDAELTGDGFSVASLRTALEARLEDLGSPVSGFEKQLLPRDPTAALTRYLWAMAGQRKGPAMQQGVWFSQDGQHALLIAQTQASGTDLDGQERAQAEIRAATNKASEGADVDLVLAGSPIFGLDSRERIRSESERLSLFASLFMLGFMALVYRSAGRVIMTAIPLLGGVLAAVAMVSMVYGYIHGITLAFGITLLGVAIDYPVHLLTHQQSSEHLAQTAGRIWPTLRLGVLTTALGYLAMSFTEFTGLAQLGLFSMTGLITAALISRYLLPVLPVRTSVVELLPLNQLAVRSAPEPLRLLLPALVLVGVVLTLWSSPGLWSSDLIDLSPVPAELRERDHQLRSQLGASEPRYMLAITADTTEQVLQGQERLAPLFAQLQASGEIQGARFAAQIIPSRATQLQRRAFLPDRQELELQLDQALLDLPFKSRVFEPFIDDVIASSALRPLEPADFSGTQTGLELEALLQGQEGRMVGLINLSGVARPDELKRQVAGAGIPGLQLIDMKLETQSVVTQFRSEAIDRIMIASVLIIILLLLGLRSFRRTLAVVIPMLLSVGVGASVPLLLGEQLNLFHLVSLLLVAGIGLDYGLFFTRHEHGQASLQTFQALLVCAISTVVVFVMLALSGIPVLHAIGTTVSAGVFSTFILSWALNYAPARLE
jgi:predicted exporter